MKTRFAAPLPGLCLEEDKVSCLKDVSLTPHTCQGALQAGFKSENRLM